MSQGNVEIARHYWEGLQDLERIPEWIARFWESDGDYYPVRAFPEARPCHGHQEIITFLTDFRDAWDEYIFEVKDAKPVGDDRVLVEIRLKAEGRASGARLEGDIYHCCWLRHGRFFRVEDHLSPRGAIHALGLSGETVEPVELPR
jgi:hypothetical protein